MQAKILPKYNVKVLGRKMWEFGWTSLLDVSPKNKIAMDCFEMGNREAEICKMEGENNVRISLGEMENRT
jgi:hypothetical protein